VRVVTWNVNSLRARLPRVLQFVEEHRPDILCLQETKCDAGAFPHAELAEAGYVAVDHSSGRWAGVAIAARADLGIEDPVSGLAGEPTEDESRWIEGTVAGIRVASVYVPNGRALGSEWYVAKLDFLEAMAQRVAALAESGVPLAVAGDMNVAPTDVDVYDPEAFVGSTHTSAPERTGLQTVLDAGGLVDAYRRLHPDEVGFTWWDYRQGHFHRGLGLRIDLILLGRGLAERLARAGIERDYRKGSKPSDHVPLVAEWAD
jgi:exodeoxyribonuclease-3